MKWGLDQNVAFSVDKWFILKNENWLLPTCDSFPLIESQMSKCEEICLHVPQKGILIKLLIHRCQSIHACFGCLKWWVQVLSVPMLSWILSVLEIPLNKELTANCGVETCTKLEELILAVMVDYSLNRVQLPLWLQQSLINGFSWYGLSSGHRGQRTYVKCAEATWNYKAGGVVHLKIIYPFFFRLLTYLTVKLFQGNVMLSKISIYTKYKVQHALIWITICLFPLNHLYLTKSHN